MKTDMQKRLWLLLLSMAALLPLLAQAETLSVVPSVDFSRYAGQWYEIARLPNRFQEICADNVSATYSLRSDGNIDVLNACRKKDGTVSSAKGVARLAYGPEQPGKLEVRFAPAWLSFLPFVWGKYWVIDLADDYSTSLVGSPDKEFLWLLSRTPRLNAEKTSSLLSKAKQLGFATENIVLTSQE